LDTTLTPELISEGYARELINKIQFTRKEQGFEIMDRIRVEWFADEEIDLAMQGFSDYIKSETLTDELTRLDAKTDALKQYDINGKDVWFSVTKVK
jgi:isoleucyl-tRNA synthetase